MSFYKEGKNANAFLHKLFVRLINSPTTNLTLILKNIIKNRRKI